MSMIVRKWLTTIDINPDSVRIDTIEFIPERPFWFTYTDSNNDTVIARTTRTEVERLYLALLEGML